MSSIQWYTGSAVPVRRCMRQPMLAVAMSCGAPASSALTLACSKRVASSGWRSE